MKKIPFNTPFITGQEIKYIRDVFKQNIFYGNSKFTKLCENKISKSINSKYVLLTDSCTSALEIAALISKKSISDEVIMPSYTFTSTAAAFLKAGFKIRFAEIDPFTAMIDPKDVIQKITKKTRALVVVHYAGFKAEITELKKICSTHGLILIEDAAQGFGSFFNKKAIGTLGDIGCFSFHETKNIHAGLSGAIILRNKNDYIRAIHIRERGTNRQDVITGQSKKYSWVELGGSYYPTEINAAFLYAQLKQVKKNLKQRKAIYNEYYKNLLFLKKNKYLYFNEFEKGYVSNYHAFFIILKSTSTCQKLRKYLLKFKIHAFIGYVPLHSSPMGIKLGNKKSDLPISEIVSKKILRLPLHNKMKKKDALFVSAKILDFFETN